MKPKQIIKVPPTNADLYNTLKRLERDGHTIFNYPDRNRHVGLARQIGIKCKPAIIEKFIVPPLSSTNKHRMTGIQLYPDVKMKEEKKGIFIFKRRKTSY